MIVPENIAKRFLSAYGLAIPRGAVARTPDEAAAIAQELGNTGVVKALIPTGGRGKAGGVKVCRSSDEIRQAAASLLGAVLLGHKVSSVLVEELVPIAQEIYAGVVANTATDQIDLILSLSGGVEIENTAHQDQQSILHMEIAPGDVLPTHRVRAWFRQSGFEGELAASLADFLVKLYRAAADLDALMLEVNPLARDADGKLYVLDCKLEVDDNSLTRQPEIMALYLDTLSEREHRARRLGVSFVPLDGDIAVITSGAGLGMATLDLLQQQGLSPANFLDTGGGISEEMVKGALELIMEPPRVRGAIINLYGGINRMLEAAKGIQAALKNMPPSRPIVVKILGNQQDEAWALLETEPDVHVVRVVQTETAVERLADLLRAS
jgi:succinyl-CoA synthetase beta subunit